MKKCPYCAEEIQDDAVKCKHCGEWIGDASQHTRTLGNNVTNLLLDKRSFLGLLGSIVLFIGVFTPIISAPIVGNLNYFQNGKGDGLIILTLAIVSVILTLRKLYNWLLLIGVLSLCVTIYTFIVLKIVLSELSSQLNTDLLDNPFKGIGELAIQSIQFQWGWALLIVGAGFLIGSAVLEIKKQFYRKEHIVHKKQFIIMSIIILIILVFSAYFVNIFYVSNKTMKNPWENYGDDEETDKYIDDIISGYDIDTEIEKLEAAALFFYNCAITKLRSGDSYSANKCYDKSVYLYSKIILSPNTYGNLSKDRLADAYYRRASLLVEFGEWVGVCSDFQEAKMNGHIDSGRMIDKYCQ